MPKIVPIVEGDGEVQAVPILIGKLLAEMNQQDIGVARTRNAGGCTNIKKAGGLERFVQLAASEPECGAILLLMDADKECPVDLAYDFAARIRTAGTKYPVVVVIAQCEYEAWFLAILDSLAGRDLDGRPGLPANTVYADRDVDALVSVKGWLSKHFVGSRQYKETIDQATMTRHLKVASASARSRSFRRLQSAIREAVDAIDHGQIIITPSAST